MNTVTQTRSLKPFSVRLVSTKEFVNCESDYPELVLTSNREYTEEVALLEHDRDLPRWVSQFNAIDASYGYPANGGEKEKIVWMIESYNELNLDSLEF